MRKQPLSGARPRSRNNKVDDQAEFEELLQFYGVPGLRPVRRPRDLALLSHILPKDVSGTEIAVRMRLLATARGVDQRSPDWIAEILFRLALEHPDLNVVRQSRGREPLSDVEDDISFLRSICKTHAHFERTRCSKVSFKEISEVLAIREYFKKGNRTGGYYGTDDFVKRSRQIARRFARLRNLHPDIYEMEYKPYRPSTA
jgi:hypothetical protein